MVIDQRIVSDWDIVADGDYNGNGIGAVRRAVAQTKLYFKNVTVRYEGFK